MKNFFEKPDVTALGLAIMDRGWNIDNVEVAVIPTVLISEAQVEGGTSRSISISPPVISLLHGNAVLPLSGSPVMDTVGWCLEAYFRLPPAVDRASAPLIADRDNALLIVPVRHLINRHSAFQRVELAARAYDVDKSDANWQARLTAEWERFQLEDAFAALPCDEATFRAIFSENASLKHPLPFLETYSHYWQSKQANIDGGQPSDFAIAVAERCVKAGIAGNWKTEIAGEVVRALNLHPLHFSLFHAHVAELVAAETNTK
jgi:hypothetical protein